MRLITLLLILLAGLKASGQNSLLEQFVQADSFRKTERFQYLRNVRPTDTLCLHDIEKASRQIDLDTLVFVATMGPFGPFLRYENELAEICKNNNLKFELEFGGCLVWEGQTEGCYKDYMDYKLDERHGTNFKANLHTEANDLFLRNHLDDTISGWDCDKKPTFIGKEISWDDRIHVLVDLPLKERRDEWVSNGKTMFAIHRPFIDLRFTIDKNGDISNFILVNYIAQHPENETFKDLLLNLSIQEMKDKYSKWQPGEINGIRMNTTNVLRVHF